MLLDIARPLPRHSSRFGTVLLLSLHADPTTTVGAPENGGVTVYVRELARALVAEGWSVDVVTRRQSALDPLRETRYGANIVRIEAGPARPLGNDEIAAHLPTAIDAVRRLARTRMYRFVSSHYWLSGAVGEAIAQEYGIGHVHTLHSHGVERKKRDAVTLQRIEVERRLLQTAQIVALSKSHLAIFRQRYGVETPAYVLPAGVDTERFCYGDRRAALQALGLPAHRAWIGYVGRLAKEKGIDDLLHAIALLHVRRPDVGLFVVGGASSRSRIPDLTKLAKHLNIGSVTEFLGPIPNDRVACAFQGADIIAVPSHYEAFGLVALEARACGTPVIASDVGGLRELVTPDNGGARVPPRDYVAWATALAEALRPQTLAERRVLAQRQRSGDVHSWRAIAETIAAIALSQTNV
jgi:glycosyltransferase involved in cell wall biosynthesis